MMDLKNSFPLILRREDDSILPVNVFEAVSALPAR